MKKFLKIIVVVFIFAGIVNISNVMAATGILSLVNFSVPAFSGVAQSDVAYKQYDGPQYAVKINAYDKISGDERAVDARIFSNSFTVWKRLPKGTLVTWDQMQTGGMMPYKLELRNGNSNVVTGSNFYGTWYLDYI